MNNYDDTVMNNKPIDQNLVSVIIPTYNRLEFLNDAIKSVINQTYRPIECIIVDDNSTDDTKKMVEKWIKNNSDSVIIKYIHQENSGPQIARNTGTEASTGYYIQYLDSDDLLYPDKIKKQVDFLIKNKDCDGVWGGWAKGSIEEYEIINSKTSNDLLSQLLTENCIVNFSFLMTRALIKKIGTWDIKIKRNQEIDFQVRGLLAGGNYKFQSQICGLWRIHQGDRIANNTGSEEIIEFYKKWEKILAEKNLFNINIRKNIANIYFWFTMQNGNLKLKDKTTLLMEAIRLNPYIKFIQTPKMKILKGVVGLRASVILWLLLVPVIKR